MKYMCNFHGQLGFLVFRKAETGMMSRKNGTDCCLQHMFTVLATHTVC